MNNHRMNKPNGYRVWHGFQGSNGASFQSSEIHSRLSSAIESARRWERKGYDTQITEEKYDAWEARNKGRRCSRERLDY